MDEVQKYFAGKKDNIKSKRTTAQKPRTPIKATPKPDKKIVGQQQVIASKKISRKPTQTKADKTPPAEKKTTTPKAEKTHPLLQSAVMKNNKTPPAEKKRVAPLTESNLQKSTKPEEPKKTTAGTDSTNIDRRPVEGTKKRGPVLDASTEFNF